MKKAVFFAAITVFLLLGRSERGHALVLVGMETGTLSLSRTSEGIYRNAAAGENVSMRYTEEISHFGFGPLFEFGFEPGKAGLRLVPFLAEGSTTVSTGRFTKSTYDLLGFTRSQVESLVKKKNNLTITNNLIGTEILFKYNAPTNIPGKNEVLKVFRKSVEILGPWLGLGPMANTCTRVVQAGGGKKPAYARSTYVDFNFIIAGGLNIHLNSIWEKIPRNIYLVTDVGFVSNLTPDNSQSVQDDNLNTYESGLFFKFGAGYDI